MLSNSYLMVLYLPYATLNLSMSHAKPTLKRGMDDLLYSRMGGYTYT